MGYRQKDVFFKLRKDADRKGLFCSNLSTLLSMIVDELIFANFRKNRDKKNDTPSLCISCYFIIIIFDFVFLLSENYVTKKV